jgi:GT2 family glycosyltransferase
VTTPLVSIVIPTRNGAADLPALLDSLRRQRADFPFEIVAIDSASTDGTPDILRPRVDRLIGLPAGTFDHGLSRNAAIAASQGALVVLLVQDALPSSDDWLVALTTPLLDDETIAGAFARQRPRDDASAIARDYHAQWVAAATTPKTFAIADPAAFADLAPRDQFLQCTFDNVCSCIRRSVWERHPFRATSIAEDVVWAREVLLAGHRLLFVPEAVVIHSHDRPARDEFRRTRILHRRLYELFRLQTIPTQRLLARAVGSSLARHWRCLRTTPPRDRRAAEAWRAFALAFAWPLGQYVGAREGQRAKGRSLG